MGLLHPAMQSYAQSSFNYLRTTSATSEDGTGLISTSYYDDWGRLWEEVQLNVGPFNQDRITYYEYDCRSQLEKAWKPVIVNYNFGSIYPTSLLKTVYKNYYGTDEIPYLLTTYENSPLCRPVKNVGVGAQWHNSDKAQKTEYLTNNNTCPCRVITTTEDRQLILLNFGRLYSNGELLVTQLEDEDGKLYYEFKDKRDRVIMTRQMDGEEAFDTYFVYDSYGNLRSVLPPMVADALAEGSVLDESNEIIQKYAFLYKYDTRNRCIAKKLPGCEWGYFIYDMSDKLIFSQDGNQRSQAIPKWTFYLYDVFQRMVLKGVCSNGQLGDIGSTLVTCVWDGGEGIDHSGYTANIELHSPEVHIVNYYDGYEFLARSGFSASHFPAATINAKGYLTGTVSRVLGSDVDSFVYKALYYDLRGRVVSQVTNNLGKYDLIHTDYTFTGKPSHVRMEHLHDNVVHTEQYSYTYGYEERLDKVEYQIDDRAPIVMSEQHYDDLGRLSEKLFHNGMYSNHYTYNIRDWLTGINGTHFSQSLHYNDKRPNGTNNTCYNGNISGMDWKVDSEDILRGYDFTYDGLSRLRQADYMENNIRMEGRFDTSYRYDKHGNITHLERYGQTEPDSYGLIDDLHMFYSGNQLESVEDSAVASVYNNGFEFKDGNSSEVEYFYDLNGNLTKDLNKNIVDIQYNYLNLPRWIVFGDGNSISYSYDATGKKLRTTHIMDGVTTTTDYCGNVFYENGVAQMLLFEGGYISLNDDIYHYFIQDHQGNNRVVVDQNGVMEEVNHYYPFGGMFTSNENVQLYKYNGKELDRKNGLNWYDYGARYYDAILGRWHAVDPMAEKYYNWGSYTYCKNNPILRIDIDGKDDYTINSVGRLSRTIVEGSKTDILKSLRNSDAKSLEIHDKNLLLGMYNMQGGWSKTIETYNSTSSLSDAAEIFKFAADNTTVEWKMDIYDDNGSKTAIIGTSGRESSVFSDKQDKLHVKGEKVVDMHSHPYNTKASPEDMSALKIKKGAIYHRDSKTLFFYTSESSHVGNANHEIDTSVRLLNELNKKFMER